MFQKTFVIVLCAACCIGIFGCKSAQQVTKPILPPKKDTRMVVNNPTMPSPTPTKTTQPSYSPPPKPVNDPTMSSPTPQPMPTPPPPAEVQPIPKVDDVPITKPAPDLIGGKYTKAEIYFKVQIGAFETPLAEDDPFFEGVIGEEVQVDLSPNGLYRYTVGYFKTYDGADNKKTTLKDKGYNAAFTAVYGNDNRRVDMPMEEILRLFKHGY